MGIGWYPGGVKYRAAYAAEKQLNSTDANLVDFDFMAKKFGPIYLKLFFQNFLQLSWIFKELLTHLKMCSFSPNYKRTSKSA